MVRASGLVPPTMANVSVGPPVSPAARVSRPSRPAAELPRRVAGPDMATDPLTRIPCVLSPPISRSAPDAIASEGMMKVLFVLLPPLRFGSNWMAPASERAVPRV